ncbi:MAG: DEAD/DEAH box helicase family protein [Pseudomonadales bacterium]|nr:DEAD/DEAH box helicase family protein [Pseudomonadales bacterium]
MDLTHIKQICGAGAFQRGKNLFLEKSVLNADVEGDLDSWYIQSRVRGGHVYEQAIQVSKGDNWFDGRCSCPVGDDCKHVAAVLLYVICNQLLAENSSKLNVVDSWLDDLSELRYTRDERQENLPVNATFRLIYILELDDEDATFYVSPKKVRLLKKGGYGKAASYSLNSVSDPGRNNDFLLSDDMHIAQLIVDQSIQQNYGYYTRFYDDNRYEISGELGEFALHKLLGSGRCYWLDKDGEALSLGEPRALTFHWEKAKGGMRLAYSSEPAIRSIGRVEQVWYVDPNSGCLGLLKSEHLSREQVLRLMDSPVVPQDKLEEVSRRLLIDMPTYRLPTPVKLDIKEVSIEGENPQLQLRLISREHSSGLEGGIANGSRYHCAELGFNYGPLCFTALSREKLSTWSKGDTLYKVTRNQNAELSALNVLRALGLVLESDFAQLNRQPATQDGLHKFALTNLPQTATNLIWLPAAESVVESARQWSELLAVEFPGLEDQGWQIIIDESFQLSFEEPEQWHAELEEDGDDWFSLGLGIDLDGEPLNLLPTLVAMLSEMDSPQQLREHLNEQPHVLVLAGDHRWLKLPSERLMPIFDTLVELYDHEPLDDEGRLRLSRHQGVQLNDLLNDPGLTWHGAEELQRINERLRNFQGIQSVTPPENFNAELRPYQQEGLNWLQFLREYQFNGILADDMGLGKTVQTLAHLLLEKQSGRMDLPALVVAPTSLMGNWRREINRFASELKVLVLHGSKRHELFDSINEHDIISTTYPLLYRDQALFLPEKFHYIVLDEAQCIKNPKSKTSQVVYQLNANHRLALTGTPMENHLGELWSIYHFLMPGFLGDLKRFNRLFRKPIENEADGHRQVQLNQRINPFLLRRL